MPRKGNMIAEKGHSRWKYFRIIWRFWKSSALSSWA